MDPPIKLGGHGTIVHIDESVFSHKPKVKKKICNLPYTSISIIMITSLQFHRGRPADKEVWVFGMCSTSTQPSLGYMEIVSTRDANTLLPIIRDRILPGTTIWSDSWRAYHNVIQVPGVGQHSQVNHSVDFIDPQTGVHTQNIESYWNRVKTKLKRMKGCHRSQLPSYLDEFMWRERYGKTTDDAVQNIYRDISMWYPV